MATMTNNCTHIKVLLVFWNAVFLYVLDRLRATKVTLMLFSVDSSAVDAELIQD